MGLAELLAQKRAALALPKPTVALYVALYSAAPRLFYLDYFENLQYLIHWLGLPAKSSLSFQPIPPLLRSYDLLQVSKYLEVSEEEVFYEAMLLLDREKSRISGN